MFAPSNESPRPLCKMAEVSFKREEGEASASLAQFFIYFSEEKALNDKSLVSDLVISLKRHEFESSR